MYLFETYLGKDKIPFLERKKISEKPEKLSSPELIVDFFNSHLHLNNRTEEYIYLMCLDIKCNVLGIYELSHGTVDGSLITPREGSMTALLCGAKYIVLIHNHPSGDTSPSSDDLKILRKIEEAGTLMSVPLLDFLICGNGCYYSAKEANHL